MARWSTTRRSRSGSSPAATPRSSASMTATACRSPIGSSAPAAKVIRISKRLQITDGYFADGTASWRPARPLRASRRSRRHRIAARQHNAQNAALRSLPAQAASASARSSPGSKAFPGLAHRMEQVGRKGNVLFVNDSKATNADAAAPALSSFDAHLLDRRRVAEGRRHRQPRGYFPRIAKAYLIGEAAPSFAATLARRFPQDFGTLERRSNTRRPTLPPMMAGESVVLLSPACASFDQYQEFRGPGRSPSGRLVHSIDGVTPDRREELMVSRLAESGHRDLVVDRRPYLPRAFLSLMGLGIDAVLRRQPAGRRAHRPRQLPLRDAPDRLPGSGRHRVMLAVSFLSPRQMRAAARSPCLASCVLMMVAAVHRRRGQGRAALDQRSSASPSSLPNS
jgi:hypothetical protein